MRGPAAIFINQPAHRRGLSRFQPRPAFSALPPLFPGNTRLFIRNSVTDQHHPAIEQHHRIVRTTAHDYDLPLPPTLPPEEIRQRLDKLKTNSRQPQDKHAAMPLGSADAI